MQLNLKARTTYLPVTALHTLHFGSRHILLSGCGASLKGYDDNNLQLIFSRQIFETQAIHGIISDPPFNLDDTKIPLRILVWGASVASIIRLRIDSQDEASQFDGIVVEVSNPVDIGDWILHGRCFRSSSEAPFTAYVITSQNVLYKLSNFNDIETKDEKLAFDSLLAGPACVLYSAYIRPNSAGNLLVAAGTVFGEIAVWSACNAGKNASWSVKLHHVLLGHKGSIFGVSISEGLQLDGICKRLLASCSDDRSIRTWDITENSNGDLLPHLVQLSDVTGFGEHDATSGKSLLAVAYGHLSRIWKVEFLDEITGEGPDHIKMISTGEDATFQQWRLGLKDLWTIGKQPEARVLSIASDKHHFGKNIWSSARGNQKIYTGGADGAIVARSYCDPHGDLFMSELCFNSSLDFVVKTHIFSSKGKPKSIKQYSFFGESGVIATTDNGQLLFGKPNLDYQAIDWEVRYSSTSMSPLLLCHDSDRQITIFAETNGSLFSIKGEFGRVIRSPFKLPSNATFICMVSQALEAPSSTQQPCILVPIPHEQKALLLWIPVDDLSATARRIEVDLPSSLTPTTACYHAALDVLVIGLRNGSLAIFLAVLAPKPHERMRVHHQVHSSDTVTSSQVLKQEEGVSNHVVHILTTGRDGTYAVHMISLNSPDLRKRGIFQTVHRSAPPFGPNIEGGYLMSASDRQTKQLVLYGFRSKDFLVWNETRQTELLSIDCGGSHRSWAYNPIRMSDGAESPQNGGCFVWTKAGSFNLYTSKSPRHNIIQPGGHGREIKALAISTSEKLCLDGAKLIATGSEDTTIRLFAIQNKPESSSSVTEQTPAITCLHVLKKHTTGVHHLQFFDKYLFSSGGCEEFFVWRLSTNVPVIGIGMVLECALPKTEMDADARITSFKVSKEKVNFLECDIDEVPPSTESMAEPKLLKIYSAYSNGMFKVFEYHLPGEDGEGKFELRNTVSEGSFCLTQILRLQNWGLDTIVTAGTSGAIHFSLIQERGLKLSHHIHQNSIKALTETEITNNLRLILTGGDDNAVGLTIIERSTPDPDHDVEWPKVRTLLISKAHAAAITAITILYRRYGGYEEDQKVVLAFATTGNDQRVKFWRVFYAYGRSLDRQYPDQLSDLQIEKVGELWTGVADVGAMEILRRRSIPGGKNRVVEHVDLLVVGVGMEVLKIKMEDEGQNIFEKL